MQKFQNALEKVVGPLTEKLAGNKFVIALTAGFMSTMPITLGASIIAILGNLPINAWQNFLVNIGAYQVAQDFVSATLSLLAIFLVGSIAYNFTHNDGKNGITGSVICLASFIALMPIQIAEINGSSTSVFTLSNMGSSGVFVAMLCGLLISWIFCKLTDKNLRIKLPEQVPGMVAESISPIFITMIIFSLIFIIKFGFTLTSFGDIFNFFNTVITKPVMLVGASPWGKILIYVFANLCWFFGLHPSPILSTYSAVTMPIIIANREAFAMGQALPYASFMVVSYVLNIGGTGNTLGLAFSTFFAKSEKFKSMRNLVVLPNIFNINEPIIFGFPVVLNPLYFIPMILTPALSGCAALIIGEILPMTINPAISLPWVTPYFISNFMIGGFTLLIITLVCMLISFIMYFPFFIIDDRRACQQEQLTSKNNEN